MRIEPLSTPQYSELVAAWREQFEEYLASRRSIAGIKAQQAMQNELPCNVWVFSIPGYRFLPAGTNAACDPAYGYQVVDLSRVDFDVANQTDAIIADSHLGFTFLGTHEAGGMARPQFVRA